MGLLSTFKFKTNYKAPRVIYTNHIKQPQTVQYKAYKKGQEIVGEIKKTEGTSESFVVADGGFIIPMNVLESNDFASKVKQQNNFNGEDSLKMNPKNMSSLKQNAVDYSKSFVVGGLIGLCGVFFAETKGWIAEPRTRNKVIGIVLGATLLSYATFKIKKFKEKQKVELKNLSNDTSSNS
jgi:hypothetical protein